MAKLGCYHNGDMVYREINPIEYSLGADMRRNQLFIENTDFFSDLGIASVQCNDTGEPISIKHNRCTYCTDFYKTSLTNNYAWFTLNDKGLINVITEKDNGLLQELLSFIKENRQDWIEIIADVFFRHHTSNWYYLDTVDRILKGYSVKKNCPLSQEDLEIIQKRTDSTT